MFTTLRLAGAAALLATLAACGSTPTERATTGALGAAGAAVLLDEDIGDAAILGAAAGAFGPCLLNPNAQGCY